jgi:hypothetical protein
VVWEYLWPDVAGPTAQTVVTDKRLINQFRSYRYGTVYPAFAGRDLTPKGTITGRAPRLVGEGFTTQAPLYGFGFGGGATAIGAGGVGAGVGGGAGGY